MHPGSSNWAKHLETPKNGHKSKNNDKTINMMMMMMMMMTTENTWKVTQAQEKRHRATADNCLQQHFSKWLWYRPVTPASLRAALHSGMGTELGSSGCPRFYVRHYGASSRSKL